MAIWTPPPPASSIRPPISTPCSAPKRWRRDERPQDTRRRANLAAAPIGPASAADAGHRAGLAHAGERLLARQPAVRPAARAGRGQDRSEEHTSELQSLMRISYAVFCLKKKQR